MDFKIDVSNYFGLDYQNYIDNLQAFALTHPSDYYTLRAIVLREVKKENMKMIYDLFYNLLTTGTKPLSVNSYIGLTAATTVPNFTAVNFRPSMSKQMVSEIAASAVKTLEKMINEAIDHILPADHLHIADSVTTKKANASLFTG